MVPWKEETLSPVAFAHLVLFALWTLLQFCAKAQRVHSGIPATSRSPVAHDLIMPQEVDRGKGLPAVVRMATSANC